MPEMEPSTLKVFSLTVPLLTFWLNCTAMFELAATSISLAVGVLEEAVRGVVPVPRMEKL